MAGIDANKLAVVFMSPHWQCDGYGIATVTRSLINDLHNVDPDGHYINSTCIVLEEESKISQKDREAAEKYNVTLAGAKLPFDEEEDPNISWMNRYTVAYYRHVSNANHIDFIIGHVPFLASGPFNIREFCKEQGYSPQIVLVVHSLYPEHTMENLMRANYLNG